MMTAFFLDIALYYMGVVTPVFKDIDNLKNPVLGQSLPQAKLAYASCAFTTSASSGSRERGARKEPTERGTATRICTSVTWVWAGARRGA